MYTRSLSQGGRGGGAWPLGTPSLMFTSHVTACRGLIGTVPGMVTPVPFPGELRKGVRVTWKGFSQSYWCPALGPGPGE